MQKERTFLITGVSSGFGRAFAEAALSAGHTVIGTVRNQEAKQNFESLDANKAHAVILDVTDFDRIDGVVGQIIDAFGHIDVLVNNAGYGHEGILEESDLIEMRNQFDVNVFGAVAMIKAVLPSMRERRSGHIINVTSLVGFVTFPGIAYYSSSKFALEGISEVLSKEVADFGINVTVLAPGSFRTDWAGRSLIRSPHAIGDYDTVFNPVRQARQEKSGKQIGDPAKAAQALLRVVESEHPPLRLLLGSDALRLTRDKLKTVSHEINQWEMLTLSTDFE